MQRQAILMIALLMSGAASAGAQTRFDVGLLLGSTRATDEGTVLSFDRGTTYQATFAWDVWRGDFDQTVDRSAVHCVARVYGSHAWRLLAARICLALL